MNIYEISDNIWMQVKQGVVDSEKAVDPYGNVCFIKKVSKGDVVNGDTNLFAVQKPTNEYGTFDLKISENDEQLPSWMKNVTMKPVLFSLVVKRFYDEDGVLYGGL